RAQTPRPLVAHRQPFLAVSSLQELFRQQREPIGHDDHLPDRAVSDETLLHQLDAVVERAQLGDRPATQRSSPSYVCIEAVLLAVSHGLFGQLEAALRLAPMLVEQRAENQ